MGYCPRSAVCLFAGGIAHVRTQVAGLYNVKQLPALFILDRKGNLVKRVEDVKKLEADVKAVL